MIQHVNQFFGLLNLKNKKEEEEKSYELITNEPPL